ncbi:MAG: nicotinamide-nucleotide amidohydrolase family protein [Mariniblastus sp.]|nr:nicotinamide-nucleotide amidohydrolase family protein [Mariniblastus sp.]
MIKESLFKKTRQLARQLAGQLEQDGQQIVFAESCTAGLVSGILAQVPGISKWLCGSSVTYMEDLKTGWLGIDPDLIARHTAVSSEVTEAMARSVLERSEAADFAVAITGHLEAGMSEQGCLAYVAVSYRQGETVCVRPVVCSALVGKNRIDRQWQAASIALHVAVDHLKFPPGKTSYSVDWLQVCQAAKKYPGSW